MSDRELLELAAKAAGYRSWGQDCEGVLIFVIDGHPAGWNPLTDDGDALRLAVKLEIHVKRYAWATTAQEMCATEFYTEHDHWPQNQNDPMRSTRRAIVRAAAEIGRNMP